MNYFLNISNTLEYSKNYKLIHIQYVNKSAMLHLKVDIRTSQTAFFYPNYHDYKIKILSELLNEKLLIPRSKSFNYFMFDLSDELKLELI